MEAAYKRSPFLVAAVLFVASGIHKTTAFSMNSPLTPTQPPPFANPSTPEEVVQNQLFYYQTSQLSKAYDLCSPGNKQATGSLKEFERLHNVPPYDLILNHERADVMLEVMNTAFDSAGGGGPVRDAELYIGAEELAGEDEGRKLLDVACCLVHIRPNRKARRQFPVWFWWEVSKLPDDTTEISGDVDGKWMVDCILPDFEDLDFETESLSIENFLDEEDLDDDDDEITIYWDFEV